MVDVTAASERSVVLTTLTLELVANFDHHRAMDNITVILLSLKVVFETKILALVPSDDKQFDHMQAQHLALYILESQEENPLFRAPVSKEARNIIDLGTGNGE